MSAAVLSSAVGRLRVATFNLSFSRPAAGGLLAALQADERALHHCAAILQRVRPDIVLLNEFDHDGEGQDEQALTLFLQRYLGLSQQGDAPLEYPYAGLLPTNTGLLCCADLDGDGVPTLPADGQGFGAFHGQYGMAVLSRWPLDWAASRSFRQFLWAQMPGAQLPDRQPGSGLGDYYSAAALAELRLSSKNHLDLPVRIPSAHGERLLHLLLSHPVPPVFDGAERRNRCRNHDEIRLWCDYLDGADYLRDDAGRQGGLEPAASFVLLGDLNADPQAGDGDRRAIRRLLAHPRVHPAVARGRWRPAAAGGVIHGARRSRAVPAAQARYWTHLRGLRLDYVLPSRDLQVQGSGIFWPATAEPGREWLADSQDQDSAGLSSDHRLVWVDLQL
jgi:endonuclease/exonuclease/phosphatase family metal-dependent hydrolase